VDDVFVDIRLGYDSDGHKLIFLVPDGEDESYYFMKATGDR